jgi:hypothetical protein
VPLYPRDAFDSPADLQALLGTLWARDYAAASQVRTLAELACLAGRDAFDRLDEALACVSRQTIPTTSRRRWAPLVVRRSEVNSLPARLDAGLSLDAGLALDAPAARPGYAVPLPAGLVAAAGVADRLTDPTFLWAAGVEFRVDAAAGEIVFAEDPLGSGAAVERVGDDDQVTLWLWRPEYDLGLVYRHAGYVVGVAAGGEAGKRLVNTVFDALTGGSSRRDLLDAVAAMVGVRLVRGAQAVEAAGEDGRGAYVVTAADVYRAPAGAEPAAAAGETLADGACPFAGFTVIRPHDADPGPLPAVPVGRGLLGGGYAGDLFFEDREVALEADGDSVRFELGGHPGDVDRFWEACRAKEAAAGQTLAELLAAAHDGRLPETINPAEFLLGNVLRNHALVVHVAADAGADGAGLGAVPLRRITPPHDLVLVVLELPRQRDSATFADAPGEVVEAFPVLADVFAATGAAVPPTAVGYTCL